ncbi:hypothetical protein V3C99_010513 [Haemonchus contortus]
MVSVKKARSERFILKKGSLKKKVKKLGKKKSKSKHDEALAHHVEDNGNAEAIGDHDELASDEDNVVKAAGSKKASTKHLMDLQKLKESDPEFYKFLQEQDADLLEFHDSDDEEDEIEDHTEDDGDENMLDEEQQADVATQQVPMAKKDSSGRFIFDGRMLDHLQAVLDPEDQKRRLREEDIRFAVEAFNACVSRVGANVEVPKYVINEQKVFYETVRLCFEKLGDAFITLVSSSTQTEADDHFSEDGKHLKLKRIKKYQSPLKQYLSSILKFANEVQSPEVIISTLKAIRRIVDLFAHFKKLTKSLFKVLVRIWSRKTLQCRVAAYVCMMQLVKSHSEHFVSLYKNCYLGFVTNSREVTAETWPLLHFMHRTFAELTVLHPNLAYPYAFVYIRQIAIHLRNAIISKKRKDMVQAVYNWQMMQCLYLWVRVVSKAHAVHDCEAICELAYPLTQLIYGVLKLYHSLRHIPLRLHCISLLIQLQANCGTYVPTLTLATELLNDAEHILAKKPKSLKDAKIVDMECTLKIGAPVLDASVWRSALCDHLFRVTLQAAHLICSQPSFPDVIVPITHKIRDFLRKIRSVEFARCFRSLLEKLEEHAKFVADILLTKEFSIKDDVQVMSLKLALNDPSSPLRAFYRQWEKTWRLKEQMLTTSKTKEAAKQVATQKKQQKKKQKSEKEEKVKEKPNKKKRKSTAAADRADETIPDQLLDLGNWSDSN